MNCFIFYQPLTSQILIDFLVSNFRCLLKPIQGFMQLAHLMFLPLTLNPSGHLINKFSFKSPLRNTTFTSKHYSNYYILCATRANTNFIVFHLMAITKVSLKPILTFYSYPFATNLILSLLSFSSSVIFILYTHHALIGLFPNKRSMRLHVLKNKIKSISHAIA
jgi:hypothetical protein